MYIYPLIHIHIYTGADINTANKRGNTPLIYAVYYQLCNVIDLFTKTEKIHLDVNAKNIYGKTALHYAAIVSSKEIALTLLASGANIFAADNTGNTPVHTACKYGSEKVLKLIMECRQNDIHNIVHKTDGEGNTPLMLAKSALKFSPHSVMLLIKCGSDLTAFNDENCCILHFYSNTDDKNINQEILSANTCAPLLLHKNYNEETPLHIAAKRGHKDTCLLYANK